MPERVRVAGVHRPTGPDPVLLARVRAQVAGDGNLPDRAGLGAIVRGLGRVLGDDDLTALAAAVRDEVRGAGPLQPLLDEPGVTDVLVNGPRQVWVDRGSGLERRAVDLGDHARVRALAVRLAAAGGQRLDDAAPVADVCLPDGTRLHAVLPPLSGEGALLSLRTVRRRAFTVAELIDAGTLAPPVGEALTALVERRATVLVSGPTGSGKTTLLSAVLSVVPADQRIVCLEETAELAPAHPHVVRLLVRHANVEGSGAVGLPELVRHALRMRPDRLVLGECRGAEVREVLTALATGHEGGWATIHANGVQDVPARLVALGALAGMGPAVVAAQASAALDVVVHLRRAPHRYVAQIGSVRRGGELVVEPVLEVAPGGAVAAGPGWSAFAARWGLRPGLV